MHTFMRISLAAATAALLLAALLAPQPARAQWVPNGKHLTSTPLIRNPRPFGDGSGGAFVLLSDESNSNVTSGDLRLLRLTSEGTVPPVWQDDGLLFDATVYSEYATHATLHPQGMLTFTYSRRLRAYAGRIDLSGAVVPGWGPSGARISTDPAAQWGAFVYPATDSSAIFLLQAEGTDYDIGLQRLNASGQPAPGWIAAARMIVAGPDDQYLSSDAACPDGSGGLWICYSRFPRTSPVTESDVYLLRVDGLGDPASGFLAQGIHFCTAPGMQINDVICPDGAGGVYVAWMDGRSCPGIAFPYVEGCYDIYLARFQADGTPAPGWPADGLPVCVWPDFQEFPHVVPDGSGGVFVTWELSGPQGYSIHAQHVLADASISPGWPSGGKRLFAFDGYADNTSVVTDQMGGLFVGASIQTTSNFQVYLQHVNGAGVFDAAWGAGGLQLVASSLGHSQDDLRLSPSLPGSVIACWNDWRSQTSEAFATRVTLDGPVATSVSLVSQDATAERVALAWQAGGDALASATVERRAPGEAFRALAAVYADGTGTLRYEDRDITPGARYAYRLVWSEAGGTQTSPEVWIEVPIAARFALTGASPNPSPRSSLSIAYSFAESAPARFELYDAQGRVVARRDLASREPGAHRERFAEAAGLRAGLYWLRLTQGANSATARVVLVD